jgi:hypothetical protein
MPAYAQGFERATHVVNIHRGSDFELLHGENPEVILATAVHGDFMELASALLDLERPSANSSPRE